jgi:hypothetical protein
MSILLNVTTETLQTLLKDLKKEVKNTKKRKPRKKFLAHFISQEYIYDFCMLQNDFLSNEIDEIKKRRALYLVDEIEAKKYGFYAKSQTEQQIAKWAENAYEEINVEYIEVIFEKEYIEEELSNRENVVS